MNRVKEVFRLDINKDKENWLTTITCVGVSTIILMLMYNAFTPYTTPSKSTLIISIVVFLANAFIICMKSFRKMEIHQIAFWTIIILGVLSALIQPILNIPDEPEHMMRTELTSRFLLFPNSDVSFLSLRAVEDLFSNFGKSYPYASDAVKASMDMSLTNIGSGYAGNNMFVSYVPQAIGFVFAKLFHVSAMGLMWFGRIANIIAYAGLSSLAIKISPQFKVALFFIAALPMSIQQAGSLSPDAMMNVSVFLLIAYFLYIFCDERFLIGKKELIVYTAIAVFEASTKVTNVIFVLLIFTIPQSRFSCKKASFWLKAMVSIIPIFLAGAWYIYTLKTGNGNASVYAIENNVDAGKQIQHILNNPFEWATKFFAALINTLFTNIHSLSHFGWLNQNVPLLSMATLFVFGGVCARKTRVCLSTVSRIFIAILAFGSYAAINLALYLSWTTVASAGISGVQGRYLIPICALFPLIFAPRMSKNKKPLRGCPKEQISTRNMTVLLTCVSTMICVMLLLVTVLSYQTNPIS